MNATWAVAKIIACEQALMRWGTSKGKAARVESARRLISRSFSFSSAVAYESLLAGYEINPEKLNEAQTLCETSAVFNQRAIKQTGSCEREFVRLIHIISP